MEEILVAMGLLERGISCSRFLRMSIDDRVLVLLNNAHEGVKTYSPPGGAVRYRGRVMRQWLVQTLGVQFLDPTSRDLRFFLTGTLPDIQRNVEQFFRRYERGEGIEARAEVREMFEELMQEMPTPLFAFDDNSYPRVAREPYYSTQVLAPTKRRDQDGRLTYHQWSYHDVLLSRRQQAQLHTKLRRHRTSAQLISEREMIQEMADNGIPIAPCAAYLFS